MDPLTQIQNAVASVIGLDQLFKIAAVFLMFFRYDTMNHEAFTRDALDLHQEYDFIIVGGGTAGSVIASRLSENPNWTVLLLEAGGDEDEISDIPGLWVFQLGSKNDWNYKTTVSDSAYCQSMQQKRCSWPRGKVLGGSSSINGLLYIRGNKADYDEWGRQGNPGWSYDEVLPYFIKSEDNSNSEYATTPYHGTGGYLSVQDSPWRTELAKIFLLSGQEMGYKVHDLNGESMAGFMYSQGTVRNGSRCSAAKAFLRPVRDRPNLHISKNSLVTKLVIDPTTKQTHGVNFVKGHRKFRIRARKEVILSAGSTETPHILMLSGIGIKEHLQEHGIPVLSNLRVGDNMQDHLGYGVTYKIDAPLSFTMSRFGTVPYLLQYVARKTGPFSTINAECMAFINTKFANFTQDWPDIQLLFQPLSTATGGRFLGVNGVNLREDVYDTLYKPIEAEETWAVVPTLIRPRSRGTIRLASANPFQPPLIDPNYFSDRRDMDTVIEGVKFALQLGKTEAFARLNTRLHDIHVPGCELFEFGIDGYWECAIRHVTQLFAHSAGTAKMGPADDPEAVVDARLRVYGISGLRVIDASIMPTIVSGNTNAATFMIGEKGAELIKEDWM